jgi:hypothetical protein
MFEFRTYQIRFINQWSRETLNQTMHLSKLSALFDITERIMRMALAGGSEDALPLARHRAVDADIESSLIAILLDCFSAVNR